MRKVLAILVINFLSLLAFGGTFITGKVYSATSGELCSASSYGIVFSSINTAALCVEFCDESAPDTGSTLQSIQSAVKSGASITLNWENPDSGANACIN